MVEPVPTGKEGVTPYLLCDGAADAIDFYKKAFDAEELYRFEAGGMIGHAEIRIGDTLLMLGDDQQIPDEWGFHNPKHTGASTVGLHWYVPDVDAAVAKAEAAGAKVVRPLEDQFYGDRTATLVDPWGHIWSLATHIRDVSEEEMAEAAQQFDSGDAQAD